MNILLDLDGTLLDTTARQCFLLQATLKSFGKEIDVDALWRAKRSGLSNRAYLSSLEIEESVVDATCEAWARDIESHYWLSWDSVIFGVEVSLNDLARNHTLGLLTARRSRWNLFNQLSAKGLTGYFQSVSVVAPAKTVEEKAFVLSEMRVDIFIGDTETDFMAATHEGIRFIGVASGQRSEDFLRSFGVPEIATDLPEAATKGELNR